MRFLSLVVLLVVVAASLASPRFYQERPSLEVGYDRNGNPAIYAERPSLEFNPNKYVLVSSVPNYRPQVISAPRRSYLNTRSYRRF